jgi:hypothetical protein
MQYPQQHTTTKSSPAGPRAAVSGFRFDVLYRSDARRRDLEQFIAERYRGAYGARLTHFADALVGIAGSDATWSAAVGFTLAGLRPLFVEQYLDSSAQDAISARVGDLVKREHIVEVGNLAAASSGAARSVIVCMTRLLHDIGCRWVVFTSTRTLLNSFRRLGIATMELADANPARLPDGGESWGTYYAHDPRVIAADIRLGLRHLAARGHTRRGS